jgi:hypothetical protein
MDDEHAIGGPPHVELDAVGTQLAREHERFDGVLPRLPARPAMREDERSRAIRDQTGSQTM